MGNDNPAHGYPRGDPRNAAAMLKMMEGLRQARENFARGYREASGHEPTKDEIDAFIASLELEP